MRFSLLLSIFLVIFLLGNNASAQKKSKDPVLLTVDNQNFTVSEFMYGFNKNSVKGAVVNQKSMDEYMDLYVNFRLKVKEAEDLGLDTLETFKREFSGYRQELAQPYLTDKSEDEAILKEAYQRFQYDIRASHIMISLPENVADNDSVAVAAYNKLISIRKKAVAGEDFAALAR